MACKRSSVRSRLAPPLFGFNSYAGVAQLVERNLAKVEVASSNLVSRSKSGAVKFAPLFAFREHLLFLNTSGSASRAAARRQSLTRGISVGRILGS